MNDYYRSHSRRTAWPWPCGPPSTRTRPESALRIDIALVPLGAALAAAAVWISNPLPAQGSAPFVVIVNAGNPVTAVTRDELAKIFLKKRSNWDNGNPVVPLDLTEEAAVRDAFTKAVHRRSVTSIK